MIRPAKRSIREVFHFIGKKAYLKLYMLKTITIFPKELLYSFRNIIIQILNIGIQILNIIIPYIHQNIPQKNNTTKKHTELNRPVCVLKE